MEIPSPIPMSTPRLHRSEGSPYSTRCPSLPSPPLQDSSTVSFSPVGSQVRYDQTDVAGLSPATMRYKENLSRIVAGLPFNRPLPARPFSPVTSNTKSDRHLNDTRAAEQTSPHNNQNDHHLSPDSSISHPCSHQPSMAVNFDPSTTAPFPVYPGAYLPDSTITAALIVAQAISNALLSTSHRQPGIGPPIDQYQPTPAAFENVAGVSDGAHEIPATPSEASHHPHKVTDDTTSIPTTTAANVAITTEPTIVPLSSQFQESKGDSPYTEIDKLSTTTIGAATSADAAAISMTSKATISDATLVSSDIPSGTTTVFEVESPSSVASGATASPSPTTSIPTGVNTTASAFEVVMQTTPPAKQVGSQNSGSIGNVTHSKMVQCSTQDSSPLGHLQQQQLKINELHYTAIAHLQKQLLAISQRQAQSPAPVQPAPEEAAFQESSSAPTSESSSSTSAKTNVDPTAETARDSKKLSVKTQGVQGPSTKKKVTPSRILTGNRPALADEQEDQIGMYGSVHSEPIPKHFHRQSSELAIPMFQSLGWALFIHSLVYIGYSRVNRARQPYPLRKDPRPSFDSAENLVLHQQLADLHALISQVTSFHLLVLIARFY